MLVQQVYELACTPFTLAEFRKRWQSWGWCYEPERGDAFGFRVAIEDDYPLIVDPLGGEVVSASLPLHYWEDYEPSSHDDPGEYSRQRQAFHAAFDTASRLAEGVLPPPVLKRTDSDRRAHRSVVWEGVHGLLILQQAAFDLQYGIEIDFWLTPCSREEFVPSTPLIDYLCDLSRQAHDERGFPPLQW